MNQANNKNAKLISLCISVVLAAVLTLVLLLTFAGIMLSSGMSGMGISILVLLINIIPVFVSGFYLGKKVEEKKYLWGIAAAAIFFLLYIGIAVIFQTDTVLQTGSYIKTFLIMIFSGMLGGMLS